MTSTFSTIGTEFELPGISNSEMMELEKEAEQSRLEQKERQKERERAAKRRRNENKAFIASETETEQEEGETARRGGPRRRKPKTTTTTTIIKSKKPKVANTQPPPPSESESEPPSTIPPSTIPPPTTTSEIEMEIEKNIISSTTHPTPSKQNIDLSETEANSENESETEYEEEPEPTPRKAKPKTKSKPKPKPKHKPKSKREYKDCLDSPSEDIKLKPWQERIARFFRDYEPGDGTSPENNQKAVLADISTGGGKTLAGTISDRCFLERELTKDMESNPGAIFVAPKSTHPQWLYTIFSFEDIEDKLPHYISSDMNIDKIRKELKKYLDQVKPGKKTREQAIRDFTSSSKMTQRDMNLIYTPNRLKSALEKDKNLCKDKMVIIDESQTFRNPSGGPGRGKAETRAAIEMRQNKLLGFTSAALKCASQAKNVLELSATPFFNGTEDLYTQTQMLLSNPSVMDKIEPDKLFDSDIVRDYPYLFKCKMGGMTHEDKNDLILRKPFVTDITYYVEMSPRYYEQYYLKEISDRALRYIELLTKYRPKTIEQRDQLLQQALIYRETFKMSTRQDVKRGARSGGGGGAGESNNLENNLMENEGASIKFEAIRAWFDVYNQRHGHYPKTFIYSNFVGRGALLIAELLSKHLQSESKRRTNKSNKNTVKVKVLVGGSVSKQTLSPQVLDLLATDRERGQVIKSYNENKIQVLIGTGVVKEGVSLRGTELIILYERNWNFSIEEQIRDRGIRLDSHNPNDHVYVVRLTYTKPINRELRRQSELSAVTDPQFIERNKRFFDAYENYKIRHPCIETTTTTSTSGTIDNKTKNKNKQPNPTTITTEPKTTTTTTTITTTQQPLVLFGIRTDKSKGGKEQKEKDGQDKIPEGLDFSTDEYLIRQAKVKAQAISDAYKTYNPRIEDPECTEFFDRVFTHTPKWGT